MSANTALIAGYKRELLIVLEEGGGRERERERERESMDV